MPRILQPQSGTGLSALKTPSLSLSLSLLPEFEHSNTPTSQLHSQYNKKSNDADDLEDSEHPTNWVKDRAELKREASENLDLYRVPFWQRQALRLYSISDGMYIQRTTDEAEAELSGIIKDQQERNWTDWVQSDFETRLLPLFDKCLVPNTKIPSHMQSVVDAMSCKSLNVESPAMLRSRIHIYALNGIYDSAASLAEKAHEQSLLDLDTITLMLQCCALALPPYLAYAQAQRWFSLIPSTSTILPWRMYVFMAMAASTSQNMPHAEHWINLLYKHSPQGTPVRHEIYERMTLHCCRVHFISGSMLWFGKITLLGRKPQIDIFEAIARMWVETNNIDEALKVESSLKDLGLTSTFDIRIVLLGGLCHAGRIKEALELIASLQQQGVKLNDDIVRLIMTATEIRTYRVNRHRFHLATRLWRALNPKAKHDTNGSDSLDTPTTNDMRQSGVEAKPLQIDFDLVSDLYRQASRFFRDPLPPHITRKLLAELLANGIRSTQFTLRIFMQSFMLESTLPTQQQTDLLIDRLVFLGDVQQACKVFLKASKCGLNRYDAGVVRRLVLSLCEPIHSRYLDELRQVLDEIGENSYDLDAGTIERIVEAEVNGGEGWKRIGRWMADMKRCGRQADMNVFVRIAAMEIRSGLSRSTVLGHLETMVAAAAAAVPPTAATLATTERPKLPSAASTTALSVSQGQNSPVAATQKVLTRKRILTTRNPQVVTTVPNDTITELYIKACILYDPNTLPNDLLMPFRNQGILFTIDFFTMMVAYLRQIGQPHRSLLWYTCAIVDLKQGKLGDVMPDASVQLAHELVKCLYDVGKPFPKDLGNPTTNAAFKGSFDQLADDPWEQALKDLRHARQISTEICLLAESILLPWNSKTGSTPKTISATHRLDTAKRSMLVYLVRSLRGGVPLTHKAIAKLAELHDCDPSMSVLAAIALKHRIAWDNGHINDIQVANLVMMKLAHGGHLAAAHKLFRVLEAQVERNLCIAANISAAGLDSGLTSKAIST
eukprot:jgi/Hompol1/5389/HPOL_004378-RA